MTLTLFMQYTLSTLKYWRCLALRLNNIVEQMNEQEDVKVVGGSAQTEALIKEENRQFKYELGHIQDELVHCRRLQAQKVVEAEEEITALKERLRIQMEDYERRLTEKDDMWKLMREENVQLKYKLSSIQEELRNIETPSAGEKEALAKKNMQLQKQLKDLHNTLKAKENAFNNLSNKLGLQAKDLHNLCPP